MLRVTERLLEGCRSATFLYRLTVLFKQARIRTNNITPANSESNE